WVLEGKKVELPPIFLAHGNQDMLIAYHQSSDLCRQLERLGADVSFVTVDGAPHEGPFWSREMLDLIFEFIKEKFEG
ncbi:MAG: alpha/beta hydrolase, partial [Eubacterium sp.]|nr:alpha/beta hydrolase [Eubacterium sp.]